jgi:hypothetical protein
LLSLIGEIGAADDGNLRAFMRSCAAAMAASADDAVGMLTFDGSQTTVSATRSEAVSVTQTR